MLQAGTLRWGWLPIALIVAAAPMGDVPALADTFHVTETSHRGDGACGSDCCLRDASIAANQHPGPDTVLVPVGTYMLRQVGEEDNALVELEPPWAGG